MIIRPTLLILGLIHMANGAFMLAAPMAWYAAIPGVLQTGPFNHHFIADIGLAFVASRVGMALAIRKGGAAYALAGAIWPGLHALLHIWGWLNVGFPARTDVAVSETVGVVLVGTLGIWAAWRNAREEGAI